MQEVKNNKKISKKVVIFSVVVLFLFVLFKLFAIPDMPNYCQEIENGWSCDLESEWDNNHNVEIEIEKICEMRKNVFFCDGQCFPYAFCYIPFDDAGKECINSDQCEGLCVVDYNEGVDKYGGMKRPGEKIKCNADNICKGTCSRIPDFGTCKWYFEIDNGYYIFHGGGWC